MKLTLIFLSLFLTSKSYAVGMCDNKATLVHLWNTKYQQIVQSPDANDINNPNSYTNKIARALCFLEDNGLPKNVNFFNFFKRVVTFAFINLESTSEAFARTKGKGIEIFPPYFDEDPIMEYKRASSLVHEARHLEMKSKNIPHNDHVVCRNGGDLDGSRNCDEVFIANWDSAGANSYEVMFFRSLYDASTYKLNKNDLKAWIVQLLDNSFNNVSPELYNQFTR